MKEIEEKVTEFVSTMYDQLVRLKGKPDLLNDIAGMLLEMVDKNTDYRTAIRAIYKKSPILNSVDYDKADRSMKDLGFLLSATNHPLVQNEIKKRTGVNEESLIENMLAVHNEVVVMVRDSFQKHGIIPTMKLSEQPQQIEQSQPISPIPTASILPLSVEQVAEQELVASQIEGTNENPNKRALDTAFPASTESQVEKLKRQQTMNLLLKLAQEDEDVAKKFEVAYGPEQYKQLQNILSTQQQVK